MDQCSAHSPPPDARLGDEVVVARQHRPGDTAEAFVHGDIDRGEAVGDLSIRTAIERAALPQPRAVHVQRDRAPAAGVFELLQFLPGGQLTTRLADGQLDDQAGQRKALRIEVGGGHRAQSVANDGAVQAEQRLIGLALMADQVRGGVQAETIQPRPLGPDPHRRQLGHDAAGHERRRGLPDQARDAPLEILDQRAFAVAVARHVVGAAPVGHGLVFVGQRGRAKAADEGGATLAQLQAVFGGEGQGSARVREVVEPL